MDCNFTKITTLCISTMIVMLVAFSCKHNSDGNSASEKSTILETQGIDVLKRRMVNLGIYPAHWDGCYNFDKMNSTLAVFEDVQKLFAPNGKFMFPKHLQVKFFCDLYGGGSYVANRMEVGFRIKVSDTVFIDPSITRFAVAHEYGHAIFDVLMSQKNAVYRDHFASKIKFFTLRDEIEALVKEDSRSPRINQLISQSQQIIAGRSPQVAKIYDLLLPYNELFADVIGVLYAGDGNAMSQVVAEDKEVRDFTKDLDMDKWQRTDSYGAMAPARSKIGKVFGLNHRNVKLKHPTEFVLSVIQSIDRLFEEEKMLSAPGYQLNETNVGRANERLVELIRQEYR